MFPTRKVVGHAAAFIKLQLPDATSPDRSRPTTHNLHRIHLLVFHLAMPIGVPTRKDVGHAAAFSKLQLPDATSSARRKHPRTHRLRRQPGTHHLHRIHLFILHRARAGNTQMPIVFSTRKSVGHAVAFRKFQLPDATSPTCGGRPGTHCLYRLLASHLAQEKLRITRT